jgi:hypothetical protein
VDQWSNQFSKYQKGVTRMTPTSQPDTEAAKDAPSALTGIRVLDLSRILSARRAVNAVGAPLREHLQALPTGPAADYHSLRHRLDMFLLSVDTAS